MTDKEEMGASLFSRTLDIMENDPLEEIFALNLGDFVSEYLISEDLANKIGNKSSKDKIEKLIINGREPVENVLISHGTQADPTGVNVENHQKQLENFVNSILGKEKLYVDHFEGRKAVEIIERIYDN
jgi:hypothetical protein